MKTYLLSIIFAVLLFPSIGKAEGSPSLLSGPMLGYVEHREVMLWLQVDTTVEQVAIKYWTEETSASESQQVSRTQLPDGHFVPLKFRIAGLEVNTAYRYQVLVDGKVIPDTTFGFRTKKLWQWRTDPPEISFLFGSCAYINEEKYDRPGEPYGKSYQIFETMAEKESDFMIWGGDNTYLREVDWHSRYGIRYRYTHTRKTPEIQDLLHSRAHYAIWDDHDYGPNNSNRSYYLKEASLEAFKDFWPNKTYGQPSNKGIYTKFRWSDAEFFLLDDRYHRSPNQMKAENPDGTLNEDKAYLGEKQIQWLKDQLLTSKATFKIIVGGGQFLNPLNEYESFRDFPHEYQELTQFLESHEIPGVIFLSGDRHFTELIKLEREKQYPLYDFTSSPLTSGAPENIGEEEDNPHRVDNTLVKAQNFAKIALKGEHDDRQLMIQVFDKKGELLWEKSIHQKSLGYEEE